MYSSLVARRCARGADKSHKFGGDWTERKLGVLAGVGNDRGKPIALRIARSLLKEQR